MRIRAGLICALGLLALGPSIVARQIAPRAVAPEATVIVQPTATVRGGPPARSRSVPIGTAVISGRVTEARTGLPVPRARIGLAGPADPVGPIRANLLPGVGSSRQLARATVSDDDGRFVFDALPDGDFTLSAIRTGFLTMAYGATKPGRPGTPIRLNAAQRFDASIALSRGGALAGSITGPNGEPLLQVQVRALRVTMSGGTRTFGPTFSAMTDDRGAYRLFNLVPGEYVIAASPNNLENTNADRVRAEAALFEEALARARQGTRESLPPAIQVSMPVPASQPPGFATVYFPGTPAISDALTVPVTADSERLGVDFTATLVRTSHVIGTITGMPDVVSIRASYDQASGGLTQARTMVLVRGLAESALHDPGVQSSNAADPEGKFRLSSLAPGRYTVFAQSETGIVQRTASASGESPPPPPPNSPVLWGRATVDVDGRSAPEVTIALQPARTVSGRVEFDLSSPGTERPRLTITAIPAPFGPPTTGGQSDPAEAGPDGTFTLSGVVPGRYLFRGSVQSIKSAMVNGQDAQDFPFEVDGDRDINGVVITITDKVSELTGSVMQPSGTPASRYTVVIAPADQRYWTPGSRRIQFTQPSTTGRYGLRGLPPGRYLLAAVADLEPGMQYDPEFLKGLAAAAVPVTIAEGGRHTQDIRLAR